MVLSQRFSAHGDMPANLALEHGGGEGGEGSDGEDHAWGYEGRELAPLEYW